MPARAQWNYYPIDTNTRQATTPTALSYIFYSNSPLPPRCRWLGLHKIFVHSKAFLHQSIILLLTHPSALLTRLQYYCTSNVQYTTPHPTPLVVAIHYTILAMAISCKGQVACQVGTQPQIGLYKMFFYFEASVHESKILISASPSCIGHTVAILLHDY